MVRYKIDIVFEGETKDVLVKKLIDALTEAKTEKRFLVALEDYAAQSGLKIHLMLAFDLLHNFVKKVDEKLTELLRE